jgi:cyclomaltodextrinase
LPHALALLFTLPGTPAIYAADEQGAGGTKYDRSSGDTEVRRPPPYLPGELPGHARTVWQLHRDLISIRRSHPWVATAVLSVREVDNRFIKYEVQSDSQRIITLLSINDQPVPYKLSDEFVHVADVKRGDIVG